MEIAQPNKRFTVPGTSIPSFSALTKLTNMLDVQDLEVE